MLNHTDRHAPTPDLDALARATLERLPQGSLSLRLEQDTDHSGEEILRAWVVVEDEAYSDEMALAARGVLLRELMGLGPWSWVHARVWTRSEQADLDRTANAEDPSWVEWSGGRGRTKRRAS